jgi:uncharacterized protein YndB with AHSA1/START domain
MAQARRSFEGSCPSTASPEQAWAVWTDPPKWLGGPIETARLHDRFELGGKITTKVKGNRRLTSTITRIEAPHLWVGVARAPGLTMTIDHVIDPTDAGILLTERLTLTGPLAGLVSRLMGGRIESTFRATTSHGAALAEAQATTSAGANPPGLEGSKIPRETR